MHTVNNKSTHTNRSRAMLKIAKKKVTAALGKATRSTPLLPVASKMHARTHTRTHRLPCRCIRLSSPFLPSHPSQIPRTPRLFSNAAKCSACSAAAISLSPIHCIRPPSSPHPACHTSPHSWDPTAAPSHPSHHTTPLQQSHHTKLQYSKRSVSRLWLSASQLCCPGLCCKVLCLLACHAQ